MSRQFASPMDLLALALLLSLVIALIASGVLGFGADDLARQVHAQPLYSLIQAWPKKYEGIG